MILLVLLPISLSGQPVMVLYTWFLNSQMEAYGSFYLTCNTNRKTDLLIY